MGNSETLPQVSILDVGCGCGGSSLGCLLTLHKHCPIGKSEITITGVDVNASALEFAKNTFNNAQLHFRGHKLNFLSKCGDLIDVLPHQGLFDIVIASKSIGELALAQGPEAYAKAVRLCSKRVNDHGVLILIDLVKHRSSLENAVDVLANEGFEGWLKTLSVFIEGVADEEEYVCACLTRGNSKGIRKE
jgi:2-polyprenyl-3-methyl-5-hydroxy-6-metoxy-1,4-benzoquinol methylase